MRIHQRDWIGKNKIETVNENCAYTLFAWLLLPLTPRPFISHDPRLIPVVNQARGGLGQLYLQPLWWIGPGEEMLWPVGRGRQGQGLLLGPNLCSQHIM